MPRHRQSFVTELPPREAFAFLARFENSARWDPRVLAADRRPEGAVTAAGTRFVLVTRLLGREWELPYEVTACDAPHRLVLTGRRLVMGYRDELTVEPVAEPAGGSRVTFDARLWLRGPLRLVQWLLAPVLRRGFRRVADDAVTGLGALLEADARRPEGTGDTPEAPAAPPTRAEIRAIAAREDDPVLRNLLITDAYHRLAVGLDRLLGTHDLNWCAYATWASKTAGVFVREEELDRETRRLLERKARLRRRLRVYRREIHGLLDGTGEAAALEEDELGPVLRSVREVSRFIIGGNLSVFAELGEQFAAFLERFGDATEPDPERLEAFLGRLKPGPSRPDRIEVTDDGRLERHPEGGQDLLRTAFAAYHRALFETDPNLRAEWILWANALAGLHEQTRLQTYIAGSLEAPVGEALLRRERRRLVARLPEPLRAAAERLFQRHLEPLGREIDAAAREATTGLVMTQRVPGGVLALGADLPAPPGGPLYPPHLERLEHPELLEVLARYGAHCNGPHAPSRRRPSWSRRLRARLAGLGGRTVVPGSAAGDWGDLTERVRYIFSYFRSWQAHRRLLEPPFDPDQALELRAGRMPVGPL